MQWLVSENNEYAYTLIWACPLMQALATCTTWPLGVKKLKKNNVGAQIFFFASGTRYSPPYQSGHRHLVSLDIKSILWFHRQTKPETVATMVAVCHCPLKVKIQPINLAKTCTTYGLVSEPEVGSCRAARAHYLDLAVTCCVIPVHRESLENWQQRVSAGQWLTSFENCSRRLPKCEGRTVDLAFFFLIYPFRRQETVK